METVKGWKWYDGSVNTPRGKAIIFGTLRKIVPKLTYITISREVLYISSKESEIKNPNQSALHWLSVLTTDKNCDLVHVFNFSLEEIMDSIKVNKYHHPTYKRCEQQGIQFMDNQIYLASQRYLQLCNYALGETDETLKRQIKNL